MKKKIVFITSTRADYGKMKTIIKKTQKLKKYKVFVVVTGMHLMKNYGYTFEELVKDKIRNLVFLKNQNFKDTPDKILSNTINAFSKFFKKTKFDLVIVHGDRIEPFAVTITCLLNNIRVAHIEGGEVSGTQDEILRHSITKLSSLHFVSNIKAKKRVIQMGESSKNVHVIGSPDMDLIFSKKLPSLEKVKKKYNIKFQKYSIAILHPVTTEIDSQKKNAKIFFESLKKSREKFIILHPNNDYGRKFIFDEIKKLKKNKNFRSFPSMRFEYFLSLLKNANLIIGNSSAGVMEAPCYGIPCIDVGNRQFNRNKSESIKNINFSEKLIVRSIFNHTKNKFKKQKKFGKGDSANKFIKVLNKKNFWNIKIQKFFIDRKIYKNEIFR